MALWSFYDYITEDGRNLIGEWYGAQDEAVQARFDATLSILSGLEDWECETVEELKVLTQRHAGLGEVRFHIEAIAAGAKRPHRRRFRPAGIWPTAKDREFILILGCEKSGRSFIPHGAFDTALLHKADLEQGRGSIREHV